IEVTNKVTCEKLPKVKVKLTKKWSGDDHGGAEVRFSVNDTGSYAPGQWIDVSAYAGQTVTISETVSGLPAGCTYTSDLPETYHIPADYTDGQVLEVTVTNDVECDEEPPAENQVFLALEKKWAGDDITAADVDVNFTVGTTTVDPGEPVDVT